VDELFEESCGIYVAKVKVKVTVKVTVEDATKAQRGVEVYLYSFLNISARWGGLSATSPGRFTSGKA
jgi:hypothetical protein